MHPFKMSSPTGKAILALVRDGDFAHPGEQSIVESLVRGLEVDPDHCILDAGCGRGGTADVLNKALGSKVFGIDLDAESIQYAQHQYPDNAFSVCDVRECRTHFNLTFDLITAFNVLYSLTVDEQASVLGEFHSISASHASVILFDYTCSIFVPPHEKPYRDHWQPLITESMDQMVHDSGWQIVQFTDYSTDFAKWYVSLVTAIAEREPAIVELAGREWFEFAANYYQQLLEDIKTGEIGGAAYHLKKLD